METTPKTAVAVLLEQAEMAHGAYETSVLGGVFDDAWAAWYAAYLLDHGLRELLPGAEGLDLDNLTVMLARLATDYDRGEQVRPWTEVFARGIFAALRGAPSGKESAPPGSSEVQTLQIL